MLTLPIAAPANPTVPTMCFPVVTPWMFAGSSNSSGMESMVWNTPCTALVTKPFRSTS